MNWTDTIGANGFQIIPAVFKGEDTDQLLDEIGSMTSKRSRAGARHAMTFAPVAMVAQKLTGIARDVLGPTAFPFRATLFDKSRQSNWLVVWHQDTALPLQQRQAVKGWGPWSVKAGVHYAHAPARVLREVLALRLHLDDSTAENGPLRVLPGSHVLGVLTDDAIHELSTRLTPVECLAPKGGVVAIRPLLIHASSKSQTGEPRRVLHIEYAASRMIAKPFDLALA
jgi:ectoine hydroxylase-related dioxygenase (phytanoyl-CoA dioxygenase family)